MTDSTNGTAENATPTFFRGHMLHQTAKASSVSSAPDIVSLTSLEALSTIGLFGITVETQDHLQLVRDTLRAARADATQDVFGELCHFPAFGVLLGDGSQTTLIATTLDTQLDSLGDFRLSHPTSVLRYMETRVQLGTFYQKMGVTPKLYLAALAKLGAYAELAVSKAYPGRVDVLSSLHKLLLFDCHFVLQGYGRARESMIVASANRDGVTGLPNRTTTLSALQSELKRTIRFHRPMSVLFIDLDHFKAVNDAAGHAEGDLVLRSVAAALARCLRPEDILGRYGGDEFVVGLVETNRENALAVAKRMRGRIASLRARNTPVTISIGVATRQQGDTLEQLIANADRALYEAKDAGRNRVVAV